MVTQEILRERFVYKDGLLFAKYGKQPKFTPITKHHRYIRFRVDGHVYRLHQLIYLYFYGFIPNVIDHKDNDRSNNKIENLREVTQAQNCLNRKTSRLSGTGIKNLYFSKKCGRWFVQMTIGNIRKVIGRFEDFELAELVAFEARNKYHGSFARS
tara:strand:+ start:626 stop:1090 length:465 start_codon:yes stop_codon:yes gene_type:complete